MTKKVIKLKYVDHDSTIKSQDMGPFYEILKSRYDIQFSDNPDYLIYGPFGDEHLKYFNSVKIFYTGECITPDFNECDYAVSFDEIDFGDRNFRYPLWLRYPIEENTMMENKHIGITDEYFNRGFCSYVVSNDFADPKRDILFDEISKYKQVSSGGRYRNNIGMPSGVEDKIAFQKKFKFSLAFENCSHAGYTTEKLMQAFASQTVPIYWGNPDVVKEFNPNSFINCNDYQNINDLIDRIKYLDENKEDYFHMLKEPALLDDKVSLKERQNELAKYLFHIFDQDKEAAFRRNLECWGKKYNDNMLARKIVYDKKNKYINSIKKILRK